jgi:ribonuclease-3
MPSPSIPQLEAVLGHSFRDRELLSRALTHSSHANESFEASSGAANAPEAIRRDNELLEFLGDAVLGLVVSQALVARFPERREGELSKLRAHLVSARHLVQVARTLELGEYLQLGRGEARSGGSSKPAILVDALEAVIAALYLEAGLAQVERFVARYVIDPELERLTHSSGQFAITDYKSALQESVQAMGKPQPTYVLASETGPDHRKTFTVELQLRGTGRGSKPEFVTRAEGESKKSAEQLAARLALEHLKAERAEPGEAGKKI